ncbi:MAG TPA: LysE/ArgO family amino acid transporter [Microbacteriaceae bacterium]
MPRVEDMESLPTLIAAAAAGLGLGLSLIIAIGAQNAYVLRQGIRRQHIAVIVVICALSDIVLIALGISGIGFVVKQFPVALTVIRFAGAAFLIGYGLLAGRRAFKRQVLQADASAPRPSLRTAVLTVLALTWLNPHVYLDTVLLLGSVANTHGDPGRWAFGLGAAIGSVLWFSLLGFGARFLGPVFARPIAWRVLDGAIAVTMLALGIRLLISV